MSTTTHRPHVPADLHYDPYDYEIDRDPHPIWKRLREEAPLYYNEELDFYALSRYDDVLAGLLDWHTYSSSRGTVLEMINTDGELVRQNINGIDSMIFTDPPGHDDARKLVNRSFTPRKVAALEDRTRELVREGIERLGGATEFDLVQDITSRIPPMIIGELLGVPAEDQEQLGHWADMMLHYDPAYDDGPAMGMLQSNPLKTEGMEALNRYISDLWHRRKADPQDDMISYLVQCELPDGDGGTRPMTGQEIQNFVILLQGAGSETTARLFGWTGLLLSRHPDQRAKLVADRSLIPNAVEELLRYEAPSPVQSRLVTEDVEWYGVTVPAMSRMCLLNGAAGRDEREYPDADRFDVERKIERHLNFGYGTHFCLGAALARMEGRVVLDELLDHFPHWEADEARMEMVHTTTVRGPARLPVRVG